MPKQLDPSSQALPQQQTDAKSGENPGKREEKHAVCRPVGKVRGFLEEQLGSNGEVNAPPAAAEDWDRMDVSSGRGGHDGTMKKEKASMPTTVTSLSSTKENQAKDPYHVILSRPLKSPLLPRRNKEFQWNDDFSTVNSSARDQMVPIQPKVASPTDLLVSPADPKIETTAPKVAGQTATSKIHLFVSGIDAIQPELGGIQPEVDTIQPEANTIEPEVSTPQAEVGTIQLEVDTIPPKADPAGSKVDTLAHKTRKIPSDVGISSERGATRSRGLSPGQEIRHVVAPLDSHDPELDSKIPEKRRMVPQKPPADHSKHSEINQEIQKEVHGVSKMGNTETDINRKPFHFVLYKGLKRLKGEN